MNYYRCHPLRLVNPDHASRLDGVVVALAVIGRGLIIEDQEQPVTA